MTLQHIVLFSYPEELSDEDATEMRRQVQEWPSAIPGFRALRFGRDLTDARTRGYQYLLYTEFDDVDALHAYQQHPVHQEFLAWVTAHECTPLAFDYHLDDETVFPLTTPHDGSTRLGLTSHEGE
jgi:heme-degrading monooxygenase HmoA